MRIQRCALMIFLAVALGWGGQAAAMMETPLTVYVNPAAVSIGTTYNGDNLFVSGTLPKDAEALIRITGKRGNEHFKKKGKALRVLWMNMGSVEMDNVPTLMLLVPSNELSWLMTHQPETWQKLGLGFESLANKIEISPQGQDRQLLIGEFLKLKERDGLYGIQSRAIHYEDKGGVRAFHASVHLPSGLVPGVYTLETFAIRDGQILARDAHVIQARTVGMPAFLSNLAFNHSLLYGILAVLVAIGAGLLIGYLFKGGGGAH